MFAGWNARLIDPLTLCVLASSEVYLIGEKLGGLIIVKLVLPGCCESASR